MMRAGALAFTLWGSLTIAALLVCPYTSRADDPLPAKGTPGTVGVWRLWRRPEQPKTAILFTVLSDTRLLVAGGEPVRAGSAATPVAAHIFDPRSGIWSMAGPPAANRDEHAAVALPSGDALLVGGVDPSKFEPVRHRHSHSYEPPKLSAAMLASTELWDPALGWRNAGAMLEPRARPRAVLLKDGRVLVTGGIQYTYGPDYVTPTILMGGRSRVLASAEIWFPREERWLAAAPMAQARYCHTATTLDDGRVLVVGGAPAETTRARLTVPSEIWDPVTSRWTVVSRPPRDLVGHAATLLRDGRVLITGAQAPTRGAGTRLAAAEVWDLQTGRWMNVAPMTFARADHDAVLLPDGRVLVAGGGGPTAEIWDPVADRWTATGPFTDHPDDSVRLARLPDGKVLLFGMKVQVWSPAAQ